jgi:hypothetical protein
MRTALAAIMILVVSASAAEVYSQTSQPNQPPVITAPREFQGNLAHGYPPRFDGMDRITVYDPDAGSAPLQVSLTVSNGLLTLNTTNGLTFLTGTGTDDAHMVFTGSQYLINTALRGLAYDRIGTDTLIVEVDDLGNTGTGGPLTDRVEIPMVITRPLLDVSRNEQTLIGQAVDSLGTVTSLPHVLTYTVTNLGDGVLLTNPVEVINTVNCSVTYLTQPGYWTLQPEVSREIRLEVRPSGLGPASFDLLLPNYCPDHHDIQVRVEMLVSESRIELRRDTRVIAAESTDYVSSLPVSGRVFTYQVTNPGSEVLEFSSVSAADESNAAVTMLSVPQSIAPASTTALEIEVFPLAVGPVSFDLRLATNSPLYPTFGFTVEGDGGNPGLRLIRNGVVIPENSTDDLGIKSRPPFRVTYTVLNSGTAPLEVSALTSSMHSHGGIPSYLVTLPEAIAPAETGDLEISVWPGDFGLLVADIDLHHNIIGAAPFRFTLQADIQEAIMAVSRQGVTIPNFGLDSFGGVPLTATALHYEIHNPGTLDVQLAAPVITDLVNCTVQVVATPSVVGPAQTETLTIEVTPQGFGPVSFRVSLDSNAPRTPTFQFDVHALTENSTLEVERTADIPDGGTDDLGDTSMAPRLLEYSLTNLGNAALQLGAVVVSDIQNCDVVVVAGPAATLAPAQSTLLQLEVTPQTDGAYSFRVTLPNNAAQYPNFHFDVTGVGGEPEIVLERDGEEVVPGATVAVPGRTTVLKYTILNRGTMPLEVTGIAFADELNCAAAILTFPDVLVHPGLESTFSVVIVPDEVGPFWARLELETSDPVTGTFELNFEGELRAPRRDSDDDNGCAAGGPALPWALALLLPLLALRPRRDRAQA